MSLETLLEAAEYLNNLEHNQISNRNTDGNHSNQADLNSVGGNLKIDPDSNLPISLHFHNYSTSLPNSNSKLSSRLNQQSIGGRTKSASFSISNSFSAYQQSKSKRNRNLTCSDKTSIGEANSSRNRELHRELHKTLEKNRRAHLRSCFEQLKLELPKTEYQDKRYSHINIIHYAIHYINQLKKTELDYKEELNKLNRIRNEYTDSLVNLKQQLIDELNSSNHSTSLNQSNDSLENLSTSDDSDQEKQRLFSVRTQKEIDDLLSQVEQSLLCASETGSEIIASSLSTGQVLDNSEPDDYDDESRTDSASECADDQETYNGSVSNVSILNQCHA